MGVSFKKIKVEILSSKSEYKEKKEILRKLANNEIDIVFSTHAIFQKKVIFKKQAGFNPVKVFAISHKATPNRFANP